MLSSTHEEELLEEGKEVAEDADEYPEADNEDLAGFGGEHEGSDLILVTIPLPLRELGCTPLLSMSFSDASRTLTLSLKVRFS